MNRRSVLAISGSGLVASLAGCLAIGASPERVKACEEYYIREVMLDDDETIGDDLDPEVSRVWSRPLDSRFRVRSTFDTERSREDEPTVHADYVVTAEYLVTDDTVYRTRGSNGGNDPRTGVKVDC